MIHIKIWLETVRAPYKHDKNYHTIILEKNVSWQRITDSGTVHNPFLMLFHLTSFLSILQIAISQLIDPNYIIFLQKPYGSHIDYIINLAFLNKTLTLCSVLFS